MDIKTIFFNLQMWASLIFLIRLFSLRSRSFSFGFVFRSNHEIENYFAPSTNRTNQKLKSVTTCEGLRCRTYSCFCFWIFTFSRPHLADNSPYHSFRPRYTKVSTHLHFTPRKDSLNTLWQNHYTRNYLMAAFVPLSSFTVTPNHKLSFSILLAFFFVTRATISNCCFRRCRNNGRHIFTLFSETKGMRALVPSSLLALLMFVHLYVYVCFVCSCSV